MADIGRLSANAKNSSVRVFANLRQKNIVLARITKIATKNVVFARICKHVGSFLSESGQKEAVLHLNLNKCLIRA